MGLRIAFAVGIPLIGATLGGYPLAGVAGGATAMFVSLCDIGNRRRERLAAMVAGLLAIIVGGVVGDRLGGTPYANETVILLSALLTGWVSGSYPAIAAIARFFAIATAVGAGMQFTGQAVLITAVGGGLSAIGIALLAWKLGAVPVSDNLMDWRAGVRRAFAGADAGPWFALCFAICCALALFAAERLQVSRPYWATMVVIMVMRREGMVSLRLSIHYIAGTLVGIPVAWAVAEVLREPSALAFAATLFAALVRVGFAVNPALGFTAFTAFLMLVVDLALRGAGMPPHLLSVRFYDVGVGCAIALAGTLVAATGQRRRATG